MKSFFISLFFSAHLFAMDYSVKTDDGFSWQIECQDNDVINFQGDYWPYREDFEVQPLYPYERGEHQGVVGRCNKDRIVISLWYNEEEMTEFNFDLKNRTLKTTYRVEGQRDLVQQYSFCIVKGAGS